MKKLNYIIRFLLLLFCGIVFSQELPPIQNYSIMDYQGGNQNWSISQSDEKIIYVANNSGLLEFNGAEWRLYPSPNNSVLRSVNVVGNKIYTGCFREFGFWITNDFGSLEYHSLSAKIGDVNDEDQNIWNIINYDDWVLFQSLHNIYIYNTTDDSFTIINSETSLPKVFNVDDSIYFQRMDDGVYKIENGKPILISNHPILQKNVLVNIYSIDKKILFQTQESGFFFLNGDEVTKWDIAANELFSSISVYSSLQLNDGSFVLGTISNGIYQIDKAGNILNAINQKNGLSNNTVLSMYEDKEQNLWLGLEIGISVVNFKTPYRYYNDNNGYLGSVNASVKLNDNLYLGTNQGLYYKKYNSNSKFKFIVGTEGPVWCLKVIDNTLFCGHNNGTYVVNGNKVDLIVDVKGTWDIIPIENNSNMLLQGHYGGLNIIEKINNKWQFRNKIDGFSDSCRYLVTNTDNEIFINHEYKGVSKLILDEDFTKVIRGTMEKSAPISLKSSLIKYNNDIIYTSKDGVFKYIDQKEKFVKDSLLSINLFGQDNYVSGKLIVDDRENTLWCFTDKNIVKLSPGKLSNTLRPMKISFSSAMRGFVSGYENVTNLNDGHSFLFGASKGYVILDFNKISNDEKEYEIKINSIEKSVLNNKKTAVSLSKNSSFKYEENNLFFKYSVPEFSKYNEVTYQYQLVGIYDKWSNWSTDSEVFFKNLSFGDYTFFVRAKIGNELSKNIATYSFNINRPWLLSNRAIIIYAISFFLILGLIHRGYIRYYNKQRIKLMEENKKKLELTELENEQKLMKLRNNQLRQDVENKNSELAISTMSLIRKNELLRSIKKDLLHIGKSPETKSVIKIIDNNLNNNNDWEFFQEAFNNADKDFLKKIHQLHPSLTPNDLRFCAYLRLNLSSKEIAPLLNISFRSVEIKRYRLRKKMDLVHEKSLVEYILEV